MLFLMWSDSSAIAVPIPVATARFIPFALGLFDLSTAYNKARATLEREWRQNEC